jgi:hypothetical protein
MGLGQFGCFVHNAEITLDAAKNPPPRRAPRQVHPTARSVRLGRPHLQHNLFCTLPSVTASAHFGKPTPPAPHRSSLLTDPTTPGLYEAITR